MKYFIVGFTVHPNYFIDHFVHLEEIFDLLKIEDKDYSESTFTDFALVLKSAMRIHLGHPEFYIELQGKMPQIPNEEEQISKMMSTFDWKVTADLKANFGDPEEHKSQSKSESGKQIKEVGKINRLKGLVNLGNTCYMNSFL